MPPPEVVLEVARRLEYMNPIEPQPGDFFLTSEQRESVTIGVLMAYVQIIGGPLEREPSGKSYREVLDEYKASVGRGSGEG